MHVLQPTHLKLKQEEADKLLKKLNISITQLPKIRINDPALPEGCEIGEIIKIDRVSDNKKLSYYRVISI